MVGTSKTMCLVRCFTDIFQRIFAVTSTTVKLQQQFIPLFFIKSILILIIVYNNRIKWRKINIYFKKYTFFESYLLEFYLKPPASE